MPYFIGIVPPEEIYKTVLDIQQKFGDNRLEPHITVRPPVTVTEEAQWITAIQNVCNSFPPFKIDLPGTGYFGKRVLFINAHSENLKELHECLLKAIKPFEKPEAKQDPSQQFNAHLTLGRLWCGFTKDDFAKMKVLADEFLKQKPVTFSCENIRVYHKPSPGGRYVTLRDIALNSSIEK